MGTFRVNPRRLVLPAFLAFGLFLPVAFFGQAAASELRVEVKDPSGAAIQAAGTLDDHAFQTDSQGQHDFRDLAPGRHRLEVFKPGFATLVTYVVVRPEGPTSEVVLLQLASTAIRVDVIETTPLAGAGLTKDQIAAPVQTATAADVEASGALDLSDFLNRRMNGVYVNENQGNPFQPDVNFRGYTASPLLGTAEGISVYLDGVRQNQPFGDVVAWDLIPKNAIGEMSMVPGSDPLFGLNTLGGAVSVQTKDGVGAPGVSGTLLWGSSGRKEVDATWGGGKEIGFNWFLAGTGFHETGWRIASPSDVRQGFVRLGWRTEKTDFALAATYANNTLAGNGIQDYRLLAANYTGGYTLGDTIAERAPMFNFIARHTFNDKLTFSGNVWFRNIRTENINPNLNTSVFGNDIDQPMPDEQATLSAAGFTGFPASGANSANTPYPYWACIAEAISLGNPDGTCDAVTVYSKTVQNDVGFSGQFTWVAPTAVGPNQLSAGALWDLGSVNYTQNTAWGYVNPNHSITNVPAWQDGSTGVDSRVNLHGTTPNGSLYFSDTLTLAKNLNLTVSGRWNRFTVNNTDRLLPIAGAGSLTGDYVFQRFNPAVGLTWSMVRGVNAYARFSQGSRAPTAIELGCADPANPCALPNALASDPPLQQVVNDTWEVGLRGRPEAAFLRNLNWNIGAFRGENHNDILFVSSVLLGTGYFQNFAKTLREGLDADLGGRIGPVTWGLDYTFLSATYQSTEILNGSGNSTTNIALSGYPGLGGQIYVNPGDRIPLIPKHTGKVWLNYQATKKLVFDLNEIAISSSYARGNENNAYQADGVYYLGPGVSPGYAVTNFRAHYDLTKRLQLGVEVDNLFDKHYYTAAQLANTAYTAEGTVQTTPFPAYRDGPYAGSNPAESATFFAPGAPRRAWAELRAHF